MIKSNHILHVVLLFVIYCSFVILAQQPTCQSNGSDGCCSSSDDCTNEHTIISEIEQCSPSSSHLSYVTPLVPDLQFCPFDLYTARYEPCPNSYVNDRTNSVGDYSKPNWVGAEFESLTYNSFSMTVMWEHADAEILSTLPNLSPVQGYEIRIYKRAAGRPERRVVIHCFCATDPSMRNVSDIRSVYLTYKEMANMIVEVRTFPTLIGQDEGNTKRNCSLLSGCSTAEDCSIFHNDCYSWPQSCLSFLSSYDPLTCVPPIYNPPTNIRAEMSLVYDNATDSISGKLNLSWEPPEMNYELFPVPNVYYISIRDGDSILEFKAVETTNINILHLNTTSIYHAFVEAYVPCSGLNLAGAFFKHTDTGCGLRNSTKVVLVVGDCAPPIPPVHGRLSNNQSLSLHSTVTFQCDSGWSPSHVFTATCMTIADRLEWVPDPAKHTCSDIDECLEGNHNCSEYAACENKHGGFTCNCHNGYKGDGTTCKTSVSGGVTIGTLIVIGLVAVIALLLFMVGGIYLVTKARRVRVRVRVTIQGIPENNPKVELEKQNSGAWYTAHTSLKPNPPRELTAPSANLSHEEFTGEEYKGQCIQTLSTNGKNTLDNSI